MIRHIWKIALVGVLGVVAYIAYGIVLLSGLTRPLETQLVDACHRVDIAPGAEDIQYDAETGLVFITADNRRASGHDDHSAETTESNGIYVLDVTPDRIEDIGVPVRVSPETLSDFRPHGLYLWSDNAGTKRLFVVNHPSTGEEIIEIFDVGEGGYLTHSESISFPEMFFPNDVVAVGPRQFYATNFLRNKHGNMAIAEILLALPLTTVVYFDGETGRTVADGLAFANGINLSPDQKTLYVAEWSKQRISVFDRNNDNSLKKRSTIKLPTAVDNLDIDDDGKIWVGGQPRMFDFIANITDPDTIVPSMGVVVDPKTQKPQTKFVSKNGEINASSVAAIAGDKLLMGAVFDGHILVCDKPD